MVSRLALPIISFILFCILLSSIPSVFCKNGTITKYAEDTLEDSHGKIIFASVIFRHGDRTIKAHYPTDPYPESLWPGGILQLTNRGKQQVYDLGKWYKKRYEALMETGYHHETVIMNSSDTDRALMSAELFLAGFYPPNEEEMWSTDELKWQPIPVHTAPKNTDNMIGVAAPCVRYDSDKEYWTSSPEVQEFYRKYQDAFEYICQQANYSMDQCSINDVFEATRLVWTVYNALFVEEINGFKLPEWTDKIYPEPSRTISEFYFLSKSYSLEMRRLKGGPLLKNIISEMEQKRAGTLKKKLHLYSGQETTIAVFLHTLDMYNNLIPNYTASVIVELRKKRNEYYVTILYRNTTEKLPYLLLVPNCNRHCTLDSFINVTKYLIIDDWKAECKISIVRTLTSSEIEVSSILLIGVVVLIILSAIIFVKNFEIRRKKQNAMFYDKL